MATLAGGNDISALTRVGSPVQIGRTLQSRSLVNPIKVVDRVLDSDRNPLAFGVGDTVVTAGPAIKPAAPQDTLIEGNVVELTTFAPDWFEKVHVLPRTGFQFGNIISDATYEIEIFNAFRMSTVNFVSFTNNTGPGISLDPDPSPVDVDRLHSLLLDLLVEAKGSSTFDSTLDFEFNLGVGVISLPASGSRIVLWGFPPELPQRETLGWLTDLIGPKDDGTEQRISLRRNPRQGFEQTFFVEEGPERQYAESILFDWQASVFGLPIWHESTFSTTPVLVGDTQVEVQSTAFRDFRVGGQVIIWTAIRTFSVMTIAVINPTSIEFTAEIGDAFDAGAQVMPVRDQVLTSQQVRAARGRVNFSEINIRWKIVDNDVQLADLSSFPKYNGKVLMDDPNLMDGSTMQDSYERQITVIDGQTGTFVNSSTWARGKRTHFKGFKATGLEQLRTLRNLLFGLRGRQISFYIPSFSSDMEAFDTFSSGGNVMPIKNIGYAQFIQARQPKNVVRVILKSGTILLREITGATEIDATREDLIVDVNWPSTILTTDIEQIEYVEKVRFDSDNIAIEHHMGGLDYTVRVPVKDVFE